MRVRPGEVRLLVGGPEASSPGVFVYHHYTSIGGRIRPDVEPEVRGRDVPPLVRKQYEPLREPKLFTSFARLAARGKPSPESALRWTHDYGLLLRGEVGVEEFRDASGEAYRALSLLERIRDGDVAALRSRLSHKIVGRKGRKRELRVHLDGRDIGVPQYREINPERSRWETVERKRGPTQELRHVEGVEPYVYPEADDEAILYYSVRGLEHIVAGKLERVRKVFGAGDDEHPRPLAEWRPQLADHCPDLLTALWYQFAQVVQERRPIKRCEFCGEPFTPLRSTGKTCKEACRQAKSRQNRRRDTDTT